MYTPHSKRWELIRRSLAYAVTVFFIVLGVVIVTFLILGYRFNKYSGEFVQGGLVQFGTRPTGATVKVGSITLANHTNSKITLNPGTYDISMQKTGYQTWQKTVAVSAGRVLWLNYARLIPSDLKTSSVLDLPKLSGMVSRAGQSVVVLLPDETQPQLELVDTSASPVQPKTVTIPSSILTAASSASYKLIDSSPDGNYVLIQRMFNGSSEWIYVDLNHPSQSVNLTSAFSIDIAKMIFDTGSSNNLFVLLANGDVREINLSSKQLSAVLIQHVYDFSEEDSNRLWYSTVPSDGAAAVGYYTIGASASRQVASYQTKDPVYVGAGSYYGQIYLSTLVGTQLTVDQLTSIPSSDSQDSLTTETIGTKTLDEPGTDLTIYSGGRLVAIRQSNAQVVYDIELGTLSAVPVTANAKTLQWLDGYYFWYENNGRLWLSEYDGTNQHEIAPIAPGFEALLSSDGKYLYSIGMAKTGYQLQRTQLIL